MMKLLKKSTAVLLALLTVFGVMSFSLMSASAGDGVFITVTDGHAKPAVGGTDKICST